MNLGIVQATSTSIAQDNLNSLLTTLQSFEKVHQGKRPHLVTTPENVLWLRTRSDDVFPNWTLKDSFFDPLKEWCVRTGIELHLGSVPLMTESNQRTNATLWINAAGEITNPYQKIHLFDVDVPGAPPVKESAIFKPGKKSFVMNFQGWKVGLSICYDLRFSDLFSLYAREEVDLILVPSAFLVPTGAAHWETLIRARAIETQAFVAAAAQAGDHGNQRKTWGHSLTVDPWGQILSDLGTAQGSTIVQLDKSILQKVRSQIPMSQHRRSIQ